MYFLLIQRSILKTTCLTSKISNPNKSVQYTVYILVCKSLLNCVVERKSKIIFSSMEACLGAMNFKSYYNCFRKNDFCLQHKHEEMSEWTRTKTMWKINQILGNHKDCFTVLYADILQHCKLQSSEIACISLMLFPWAAMGEQLLFSAPYTMVLTNWENVENPGSLFKEVCFCCLSCLTIYDSKLQPSPIGRSKVFSRLHRESVENPHVHGILIPVAAVVLPDPRPLVPLGSFYRCCWRQLWPPWVSLRKILSSLPVQEFKGHS